MNCTDNLEKQLNFEDYTAEQMAARLLMIDIPAPTLSEEDKRHLSALPWGGVAIFSKNIVDEPQLRALVNDINDQHPLKPMLAVDQEGGIINRINLDYMSPAPSAYALGYNIGANPNRLTDIERAYRILGTELNNLGIHTGFSPCLDVNSNPDNPVIGTRSFGEDAQIVAQCGRAAIRGLQSAQTCAVAKHFPGHGNTTRDSHLTLPVINATAEELEKIDLVPFQEAIASGVESIMTAHILFPALDPELPATLSKTILTGLLREKMGFKGVIMSDSLGMRAIADKWGYGEATVLSIEAGADLILALGTYEQQLEAHTALVQAIQSGRISKVRIMESLQRVAEMTKKYPCSVQESRLQSWEENRRVMRRIARDTVAILHNEEQMLPLHLASEEKLLVIAPDMMLPPAMLDMTAASWSDMVRNYHDNVEDVTFDLGIAGPAIGELGKKAATADAVILLLHARAKLSDSQIEVAQEVLQVNPRTILVPMVNPHILKDLPPLKTCITAFNNSPLSLEAIFARIMGR